ncbi:hypothetical protein SAMN04487982_110156 [Streptomyces sp. ok210]|nr:hypothetical protein SAMN04487982_110156 [Streptomyces sp. ok210]
MNPPTSACHRSDLIVQIVHCGPRDLPSNADSVVRLPRFRYCGDDTDLVQASVDAVNKVRPIPSQCEVSVSGSQILLRCPGNDPYQLMLLYMRHSHAYRLKPERQLWLVVAFQLFLNDLNRSISFNHFGSISYDLDGYHQVSCSLHVLADDSGRTRTAPTGAAALEYPTITYGDPSQNLSQNPSQSSVLTAVREAVPAPDVYDFGQQLGGDRGGAVCRRSGARPYKTGRRVLGQRLTRFRTARTARPRRTGSVTRDVISV